MPIATIDSSSSTADIRPAPGHVERLHAVVDRDRDRLRLAGNAAADHQHDAELAERVRERQHRGGDEARPCERQLDAPQALQRW